MIINMDESGERIVLMQKMKEVEHLYNIDKMMQTNENSCRTCVAVLVVAAAAAVVMMMMTMN